MVRGPRPQAHPPRVFDDTDPEYSIQDYFNAVRKYCEHVYREHDSPEDRLNVARSYLGGKVNMWDLQELDRNLTWSEWESAAKQRWADPNQSVQAFKTLRALKQQTSESAHDYTTNFARLCIRAEYSLSPLNVNTLTMYLEGLQPDLRTSILAKHTQQDLIHLIARCVAALMRQFLVTPRILPLGGTVNI